jgi:hypothetical protein
MMRAEARSGGSGSRLRSSGVMGQHGDGLKGREQCRGSMRLGRQRNDTLQQAALPPALMMIGLIISEVSGTQPGLKLRTR